MTRKTDETCQSDIAASIHEMMHGAAAAGVIDKQTMREFDSDCLAPTGSLPSEDVRAPRERDRFLSLYSRNT